MFHLPAQSPSSRERMTPKSQHSSTLLNSGNFPREESPRDSWVLRYRIKPGHQFKTLFPHHRAPLGDPVVLSHSLVELTGDVISQGKGLGLLPFVHWGLLCVLQVLYLLPQLCIPLILGEAAFVRGPVLFCQGLHKSDTLKSLEKGLPQGGHLSPSLRTMNEKLPATVTLGLLLTAPQKGSDFSDHESGTFYTMLPSLSERPQGPLGGAGRGRRNQEKVPSHMSTLPPHPTHTHTYPSPAPLSSS